MADNNRWGIVYCPKGVGHGTRRWSRIEKALKQEEVAFDFVQSESSESVSRLVKMLVNNGYHTIIIVGGDSALNDTANCLMQLDSEKRANVAFGVIPNGVMNDFADFWGAHDGDVENTIRSLARRRVRKIDAGRLNYTNKNGEKCHRYFLNCINVGLIANIMNLRRRTRHIFFGSRSLSFLTSFLLMIFQRMDYPMYLKINDDTIRRRVMTLCVGNARGYGQTPNAVPYNGLLDVSVVYHPKVTQLFEGIYLFVSNRFLNHRSVHPYRTRKVEILQSGHALVGLDGRLLNCSSSEPMTVTVEQEVLNFILPA